jgi:RNA polymerase sigma-54 factor
MLLQTQAPLNRPLTTAHLATTMSLMSLTALELREHIEAQLASNPALELVEAQRCPSCGRPLAERGPCPVCSRPSASVSDEPIVFISPREDFYTSTGRIDMQDLPGDETAAETEELPTYVLRQIAPDLAPEDRRLAAHMLTSLDEDGLLRESLAEIARYHHVPLARIEAILRLIQRADPVGVGSPSPQEALLVQLEVLGETQPIPLLADQAIRQGMELLSKRHFAELGKLIGVSTNHAREIARFISDNLHPYPARMHWGNIHQGMEAAQDVYHFPDIIISQLNDAPGSNLVVEVISPLAGRLRINTLFRQSLQIAPQDKSEQWHNDLEQASLLIKCLQQRNHTIVRLVQRVTAIQRGFILHGDAYLEPLTRASLADELEVHESTISRAVAGKAVQLPNGKIVPLKKMFDRSLHIRTELCQIIAQENRPLTDTELAVLLKKKGYKVARRTVAKYRSMEGILPAHLRQSLQNAVQVG